MANILKYTLSILKLNILILIAFFKIKFIEKKNKNYFIFFCYGSTSDMMMIASLLQPIKKKYNDIKIICIKSHENILKIYNPQKNVEYYFIDQFWSNYFIIVLKFINPEINKIKKGILVQANFNFFYNINNLHINFNIPYKSLIEFTLGLEKNTLQSYPYYDELDNYLVDSLLNKTNLKWDKIILINPISYTHMPISNNIWNLIADAFYQEGFAPLFNIRGNKNNKFENYNFNYDTIEIPAHLVPLLSSKVYAGCARMGGGFDLLKFYTKEPTRTILIKIGESFDKELGNYRKDISNFNYLQMLNEISPNNLVNLSILVIEKFHEEKDILKMSKKLLEFSL